MALTKAQIRKRNTEYKRKYRSDIKNGTREVGQKAKKLEPPAKSEEQLEEIRKAKAAASKRWYEKHKQRVLEQQRAYQAAVKSGKRTPKKKKGSKISKKIAKKIKNEKDRIRFNTQYRANKAATNKAIIEEYNKEFGDGKTF